MLIKNLLLTDFRNYSNESVTFDSGLNLIRGENAAGKTNLLEAVYMFAVGKSVFAKKEKELVRMGANIARIKATVSDRFRDRSIDIRIDSAGKKQILCDGIPLLKASELLGYFKVVFFSPDDLKMISEAPSDRRRFMDVSLSQQAKRYYLALAGYNGVLAQRNKLLKEYENKKNTIDTLDVWDVELVRYGEQVIRMREEFLRRLAPIAEEKHYLLSGEKEKLTLAYEGICGDNAKEEFESALLLAREKDMELKYTTVGPHRDDIDIKINNTDVKKFGSRGQRRTASLALKLAETQIFKELSGEYPVLLLDDVMSELDDGRKGRLVEATRCMQTIITDTEFTCGNAKIFNVNSGKVN